MKRERITVKPSFTLPPPPRPPPTAKGLSVGKKPVGPPPPAAAATVPSERPSSSTNPKDRREVGRNDRGGRGDTGSTYAKQHPAAMPPPPTVSKKPPAPPLPLSSAVRVGAAASEAPRCVSAFDDQHRRRRSSPPRRGGDAQTERSHHNQPPRGSDVQHRTHPRLGHPPTAQPLTRNPYLHRYASRVPAASAATQQERQPARVAAEGKVTEVVTLAMPDVRQSQQRMSQLALSSSSPRPEKGAPPSSAEKLKDSFRSTQNALAAEPPPPVVVVSREELQQRAAEFMTAFDPVQQKADPASTATSGQGGAGGGSTPSRADLAGRMQQMSKLHRDETAFATNEHKQKTAVERAVQPRTPFEASWTRPIVCGAYHTSPPWILVPVESIQGGGHPSRLHRPSGGGGSVGVGVGAFGKDSVPQEAPATWEQRTRDERTKGVAANIDFPQIIPWLARRHAHTCGRKPTPTATTAAPNATAGGGQPQVPTPPPSIEGGGTTEPPPLATAPTTENGKGKGGERKRTREDDTHFSLV